MHTHIMQYVEVCELLAGARDILHYETVGNFCDKHNEYGGKFFLQSSTTSRSALRISQVFQQITSFLEEVVPVGMHTLQARKNNKIVRPRLVASNVKLHWVRYLET